MSRMLHALPLCGLFGMMGLFLLSGCGGSGYSKKNVAWDSDGELLIAVIAKSSTNPVFPTAHKGAEDAARKLSEQLGIKIRVQILTPPTEDGQVQAQRIAQAVNNGADAILISCSDATKVTGAIDDAVASGVAVMTFDSDAPNSKRFTCYSVDDLDTGKRVMAELAAQMRGKGTVAILAGNQNAPNLQRRVAGVKEEATNHAGIALIQDPVYHEETPQEAAKMMTTYMQARPEVNGWALVGGWPLFTKALLTDLDGKDVKIVSVDALPAQLPYVEKGIAPVLLAQPTYRWGYDSVGLIVDKLVHKKEVPAFNRMELVRVDHENLKVWAKQLKDWGFDDVPSQMLE